MRINEIIADKIEEIIGQMFVNFSQFDTGATEYSMFYNPQKHPSWFIVIFFAEKNKLKESLNNGACYQVHNYLQDEFKKFDETRNIERIVLFEPGARPVEQNEIEKFVDHMLDKHVALKTAANDPEKVCANCGHDFDKHQLLCNMNEGQEAPTGGWMICPEEDCTCFHTWGANWKP